MSKTRRKYDEKTEMAQQQDEMHQLRLQNTERSETFPHQACLVSNTQRTIGYEIR